MAQMTALVKVLCIFLVIIAIGYILRKKRVVSDSFDDDLNALMMNVTLPLMLVGGFTLPFDQELTQQGFGISLIAFACLLTSFLIGLAGTRLFHVEPSRRGVWLLITTFANLGFMGFPVIEAMFGAKGLFLAAFVQITYATCFFSLGSLMMANGQGSQRFSLLKVFLSPVMLSIEFGLVLYFTQIKLPDAASSLLSMVGSMTGPIAMLIIGIKLSRFPLIEVVNDLSQYKLALSRLLAAPIMVILLLRLIPTPDYALLVPVMVIISAMPGPGNATNMAITYGGDADFAAKNTALSAILCLFTLPVVFLLLRI